MDWKLLIADLQATGLTQKRIAVECQTVQSHISGLARGLRSEPGHSLGERLRELHRKRCGSPGNIARGMPHDLANQTSSAPPKTAEGYCSSLPRCESSTQAIPLPASSVSEPSMR